MIFKHPKTSLLLIMVVVMYFLILPVSADVINPGEKNIPFTYQIINIQDYPDYVFILHGTPNPSFEVLNSSEFSFYKLSTCSIYAVPRTVLDSVQLSEMDDNEVESFLNNDSRVARSNITLGGSYGTVNVADTLDSALIILKINSIHGNTLDIQKEKIIFGYSNGQKIEKPFMTQNQTPEPGAPQSTWDSYVYYIIAPILAISVILFIIFRRKTN